MDSGQATVDGVNPPTAGLFSYRPEPGTVCDLSLDELAARYRKWESRSAIPLAILMPTLSWLWHGFFVDLQSLVFRRMDPGVFLLQPAAVVWVPAMMLGMCSSLLPMHLLYNYLLGERYAEYTHYVNLRTGVDGWRAMRWVCALVALCCAAVVPTGLGYYTRFSQDTISIHETFAFGERNYRYSEIEELRWKAGYSRQGSRGQVHVAPRMEIQFRDGYCWSGHSGIFETPEGRQREIAKFVSERSGQPIVPYSRQ